jgi:hypothetical protein
MRTHSTIPSAVKTAARLALAVMCLGALGACISIPQRAWRNGEAMSQSRAYREVMSGNMSFQTHRQLQQSLDPLRLNYREVAFPPFGQWW